MRGIRFCVGHARARHGSEQSRNKPPRFFDGLCQLGRRDLGIASQVRTSQFADVGFLANSRFGADLLPNGPCNLIEGQSQIRHDGQHLDCALQLKLFARPEPEFLLQFGREIEECIS